MNKVIKWNLTKNSACMNIIHILSSALNNRTKIAIIGNMYGFNYIDEDWNDIFTVLNRAAIRHTQIHFYIDDATKVAMMSDRMFKRFMSKINVIIHIVKDWDKFHLGEEMKFDAVVMNPPFCSGLHLKVLKEVIPHVNFNRGGEVLCIHPAAWMQFPTRERNTVDKKGNPVPHFMNGLIAGFDMVERKDANEMFDIDGGDLVITNLKKDGMSFVGDAANDPQFCCFKFNSRFAANWKIVQAIYSKVIAKCPAGTFNNAVDKHATTIYSLRFCLSRSMTQTPTMSNKTGGNKTEEDAFKIVSKHYEVAQRQEDGSVNKFLNFATEQERYNAWRSYLTKFARFCVAMDESTKLAPYMDNYQQPWDDQRFYQHFGLTDTEIWVIENTIKD